MIAFYLGNTGESVDLLSIHAIPAYYNDYQYIEPPLLLNGVQLSFLASWSDF